MVIVTITNNSASPISNWAICFDYADSIENIWDAVIEANANGAYIIRNNIYNESIPVGGSVSFGFTSTYSENTVLPTFIKIVPNVVKPINADISYLVYYDDEYSLSSAILITNNTGSEIKNWTLTFDMDRSIQSVSNANVSGTDGISYALTYPEYASHIALGATTQIGVTGNAGVIGTTPTNFSLTGLVPMYNLELDTDGDGVLDFIEVCVNGTNPEVFDEIIVTPTVTSEVTEVVTPSVTQDITPEVTEVVTPQVTEDVTPEVTEDITPEVTEVVTPQVTEDVTPTVSVVPTQSTVGRIDTDRDGLTDEYEIQIGTDITNIDSDSDGVSDYIEVICGYNPLSNDSDNNGILDGDEDFDNDGFTNLQETELGTECFLNDSDIDGLTDGDEISLYSTNPNNYDTDEDGVSDGDEILLGKNPLDSSDGSVRIQQTISTEINNEEDSAITSVDITMETVGNLADVAYAQDLYNIDEYSTDVYGRLGSPIGLNSSVDFDLASIAIHYDESALGDTQESNLGVLWYDEASGFYIIQDQAIVDTENNVVTLDLTHFSTYVLVDLNKWNNPIIPDYSAAIYVAYDDFENFDFTQFIDRMDDNEARTSPIWWDAWHTECNILSTLSMTRADVRSDEYITVRHYYFEYLVQSTTDRNSNGLYDFFETTGILGTNGMRYYLPANGNRDSLSNFEDLYILYKAPDGRTIQIIDYFTREVLYTSIYGSITDPEYAGLTTFMNALIPGDSIVVGNLGPTNNASNEMRNYYNQLYDTTGNYSSDLSDEIVDYLISLDFNTNYDRSIVEGYIAYYSYLRNNGMSREDTALRMSYLNDSFHTLLRHLGIAQAKCPDRVENIVAVIENGIDLIINRESMFNHYMAVCDTVAQFYVNDVAYYCTENDGIPDYYQYVDVGIINGSYVRADCSGMVSAILVQAGFLKPIRLSCSTYSYEYDRRDTWDDSVVYEMEIAGFVWHPIDTAAFSIMTEEQLEDYLQNGDIMLSSSHIEIFDCVFYENNIPFLSYYSWGRAYPAEPAVSRYDTISIHYIEYEGFWRYEG